MSGLKKQYDRKALEMFDVVGCYFLDVFYNDIFQKAKAAFSTGHSTSLTESYRSHVTWFMRGIADRPKNYIEVMKKLLEYYNSVTNAITSTLNELENKILTQFIPPEYYQDFSNRDKENVLHKIIIRAVNQLGELVLEPSMFGKIIDDHSNEMNIRVLQDKMTDVFITIREEYYSKFVNEISKSNGNQTVSRDQFNKLKKEYANELKKRLAAESERDRAVQLLQVSLKKISELEETIRAKSELHVGSESSDVKRITPTRAVQSPNRPQVRIVTPDTSSDKKTKVRVKKSSTVDTESVGLKFSDLAKDVVKSSPVRKDVTAADSTSATTKHVTAAVEPLSDDSSSGDSNSSGNSSGNSSDNSDSDGEDSRELHRRQKAALLAKRTDTPAATESEFSIGIDDDPGFG